MLTVAERRVLQNVARIKGLIDTAAATALEGVLTDQVSKILQGLHLQFSFNDNVGVAYFDPVSVGSTPNARISLGLLGQIAPPSGPPAGGIPFPAPANPGPSRLSADHT